MVGKSGYSSSGSVSRAAPGAVPGGANAYAQFGGEDAMISTTLAGGIGTAGSILAWVKLAQLPSQAGRFFYVAGESEPGNDLDLQFETDDRIKFFTGGGSSVSFAPPAAELTGRWHMVVAIFDTRGAERAIYWDGKPAARDADAGMAGKTKTFTIGASPVWGGRAFSGGIDEVALWNRALGAKEVAAIYAAALQGPVAPPPATAAGPFATTATVEAEDARGPVRLKREEQIALMFLTAIQNLEDACQLHAGHACTLNELLAGPAPADKWPIGRLKFDPAGDANYTYTVRTSGKAWEAHADPKKAGLGGFYFYAKFGAAEAYYNAAGSAGAMDDALTSRSVMGDSFATR